MCYSFVNWATFIKLWFSDYANRYSSMRTHGYQYTTHSQKQRCTLFNAVITTQQCITPGQFSSWHIWNYFESSTVLPYTTNSFIMYARMTASYLVLLIFSTVQSVTVQDMYQAHQTQYVPWNMGKEHYVKGQISVHKLRKSFQTLFSSVVCEWSPVGTPQLAPC